MSKPNFALWSLKGGVGKSSISANLANTLKYGIVTNDVYSAIDMIMPEGEYLKLRPDQAIPKEILKKNNNLIFDLGGYLDKRVKDALSVSKYVMIPIIDTDKWNIQGLISSIAEVKSLNNNIVIVLNNMEKDKMAALKEQLKKQKYPYPIFEISASTALDRAGEQKESIREMVKRGGLLAYNYKDVNNQFEKLINYLTK